MVYKTTAFATQASYMLRVTLINNSQIFTKISVGNGVIGVHYVKYNVKVFVTRTFDAGTR